MIINATQAISRGPIINRNRNCFTFNGNETNLKKSYLIGPTFGLQLVLYVKVYESLLKRFDISYETGAVIRIGNSSYSRFVPNGGIFVSSGFSTYIEVEREFRELHFAYKKGT